MDGKVEILNGKHKTRFIRVKENVPDIPGHNFTVLYNKYQTFSTEFYTCVKPLRWSRPE